MYRMLAAALAGLSVSGAAYATDCHNLYAARVAEKAALADCHLDTLLAAAGPCAAGLTANECAEYVYDNAELLTMGAGAGDLEAVWLPPCLDGTATCGVREVGCYDGTRPMVYADKAVDDAGVDIESNKWVIYLGGEGGPCEGTGCWDMYRLDTDPFRKAMSTYHPDYAAPNDSLPARGLMSDEGSWVDSSGNAWLNDFHEFNRIEFDRCSDGATNGTQTIATYLGLSTTVYHHGDRIYEALANYLDTGSVTLASGTLPDLSNATHILLAGSSDGGNWVIQNADNLADLFTTLAPAAEVKILVDGNFGPMIEIEESYNGATDLYDGDWGNSAGYLLPVGANAAAGLTYSTDAWVNVLAPNFQARSVNIDDDCATDVLHGGPEICTDHMHTLVSHVATPFFILADQRDPVLYGHRYADDATYRFTTAQWRTRILDQAIDLWSLQDTDSHLALGGASLPWDPGIFLTRPNNATHVHLSYNDRFFATSMTECTNAVPGTTWTLPEALWEWVHFGTGFDAWEDWRTAGVGAHWVTGDGSSCGAPQ